MVPRLRPWHPTYASPGPLTGGPIASNGASRTPQPALPAQQALGRAPADGARSSPTPACCSDAGSGTGWRERRAGNAIIRTNQKSAPRPVDQVLRRGVDPSSTDQYAVVSATGTYDPSKTVIIRYQTRDGASGVDVVVPLVTSSGTALLVDRGWFATSNQGLTDASQVPAAPSGTVTVTGWVRQNAGRQLGRSHRRLRPRHLEHPDRAGDRHPGLRRLRAAAHGVTRAGDPPGQRRTRPTSATARTSSTPCSGGSSASSPSSDTATSPGRSAPGVPNSATAQQPAKKPSPVGADRSARGSEGPHDTAVDGEHGAADERRGGAEQERRGTAEL